MRGHSKLRERRVRQFEHYLALMEHRRLQVLKADCFLVFSVPIPDDVKSRMGRSETRIVQHAFEANDFYIDLPDTTMTLEEAQQAVADRPGFMYALDKPRKTLGERQFDPVQQHYLYSEQAIAAEDAAYVFFDLWRTPLDAWIKVEAAAFASSQSWETGFSIA